MTRFNSYMNNVSGYSTDEAPPDFRGGLLEDDMGLGKTLSMICLVAANQAYPALSLPHIAPTSLNSMPSAIMKTTLLIVPPACTYEHNSYYSLTNAGTVIQTWEKQFFL